MLALIQALIASPPDDGLSTDELVGVSGLSSEKLRSVLHDLERLGIASNATALTAYLQVGVENSSQQRFDGAARLEGALIELLRERAPDLARGESPLLYLRLLSQHLQDEGHPGALPLRLRQLLASLAGDGRNDDGGLGSIAVWRIDGETVSIRLQRDWPLLAKIAKLRRTAAAHLLDHLLACVPKGVRGADVLAETTLGRLLAALEADLLLKSEVRETSRLLDRALLWLDQQGTLGGRLAASYSPPAGMDCVAARVTAIIVRTRAESEPEYLDWIRCERWEVVLPELVFALAVRQA